MDGSDNLNKCQCQSSVCVLVCSTSESFLSVLVCSTCESFLWLARCYEGSWSCPSVLMCYDPCWQYVSCSVPAALLPAIKENWQQDNVCGLNTASNRVSLFPDSMVPQSDCSDLMRQSAAMVAFSNTASPTHLTSTGQPVTCNSGNWSSS